MAIACFLFFTLPPLPSGPERKVPFFLRRIALATVFPAPLPYLRRLFFLGGIVAVLNYLAEINGAIGRVVLAIFAG